MLKTTKIKLEIYTYPHISSYPHKVFRKCARGCISYISNRCNKANNKYLQSYEPNQELKHIIQLDANNLVMQCLNFFQKLDSNG